MLINPRCESNRIQSIQASLHDITIYFTASDRLQWPVGVRIGIHSNIHIFKNLQNKTNNKKNIVIPSKQKLSCVDDALSASSRRKIHFVITQYFCVSIHLYVQLTRNFCLYRYHTMKSQHTKRQAATASITKYSITHPTTLRVLYRNHDIACMLNVLLSIHSFEDSYLGVTTGSTAGLNCKQQSPKRSWLSEVRRADWVP